MNEKDAIMHYKALQHAGEGQTEIRVFDDPYKEGKSFYVWNQEEFIETCNDLQKQKVRVYVGLNQRSINKNSDADIIAWNSVYIDIEGSPHSPETKPFALELTRKIDTYLQQQGLCPAAAETGAGYNIFLFFEERIEIDDKTRPEMQAKLQSIKSFLCNKFTHPKAHVDQSVFNPSRIVKIIGSFDFKWQGSTNWIRTPTPSENRKVESWINSLPKIESKAVSINNNTKTPGKCAFCEFALRHQLPEGGRYERVAPSLAAYVRDLPNKEQLHTQFQAIQDPSRPNFNGLDQWDRKPSKFWCGQLQHFSRDNNLWDTTCKKCARRWLNVRITGLPA